MLITGSRALKHAGDQYLSSAKRQWDHDYIVSYEDFLKSKSNLKSKNITQSYPVSRGKAIVVKTKEAGIHEFEIAWEESSAAELLDLVKQDSSLADKIGNWYIAKPDLIYTLKKSHRFLKDSPHFLKTMLDFKHLEEQGCVVPEVLENSGWYKRRTSETYWYKHPNLNQNKDNFFGKEEYMIYDHDTLHLSVMHLDRPAYEFFKSDNKEVLCSKELFEKCSDKIKLYSCIEEASVLALERSQIVFPGKWSPRKSFEFALQKLCSSISSGWYRTWCWNHYFEALDGFNPNYVDKFWKDVESGLVKKL